LFKKVNDTYSHQIGDEVLKRVAILMQMNCRKEDVVARYGGEEFVLLFPETTTEKAVIACEKVRTAIEKFDWSHIHPDLKITISIGICGDTSQPSFEKMLSIADQHLYRAKQNGRNQVCY
ncbi:MAG: GGDEF domain-containing protein, partial [Chlorobiales bacterium]